MAAAFLTKKTDVTKQLDQLWAATKDLPRGSVVTYTEIEEACGMTRESKGWASLVRKWKKKFCDERGGVHVDAQTTAGVGFLLYTIDNTIKEVVEKNQKSATRSINKAAKAMMLIPDEEMTDQQLRLRHAQMSQLSAQKDMLKEHKAKRVSWVKSPESLPVMPVIA